MYQQKQSQQPQGVSPLSAKAQELHSLMVTSHSSGYLYTQAELQELVSAKDLTALLKWVQELTNAHLVKLAQQDRTVFFEAVSLADALVIKTLSPDEALIYGYIREAGRDGIWTKTLHGRTNLHHNVVTRCLKSLEALRHIKQVKSVKNPTRKIYMLTGIEPSLELSGGPWFTDAEIDTEFIDSLTNVICRFVDTQSFPSANGSEQALRVYAANYKDFPTVQTIAAFVKDSGIANVDLTVADIKTLCEVCVYDGRLEKIDGGYCYKATLKTHLQYATGTQPQALISADVVDFEFW